MSKITQFTFVFLMLIVSSYAENQVVVLNQTQTGVLQINATQNVNLQIRVKGNPGTGFNWYVDNADQLTSQDVLVPLNLNEKNASKDYIQNRNTNGVLGQGGYYSFEFLPANVGTATI